MVRTLALIAALLTLPAGSAAAATCGEVGTPQALVVATRDARAAEGAGASASPVQLSANVSRSGERGAASDDWILLTLKRPDQVMNPEQWQAARFIGAARTTPPWTPEVEIDHASLWVQPLGRTADEAHVQMETPEVARRWLYEWWDLVVAVCDAPNDRLIGFAVAPVRVHAWAPCAALAAILTIAGWLVLTLAAWKKHARRLHMAWLEARPADLPPDPLQPATLRSAMEPENRHRLRWKLWRALDPVFISQDGLGSGSLGRFQLFLFSVAVAAIVFYIWTRTSVLVGFSNDVLALLGITATSTGLSRLASALPVLSAPNQALLLRLGVVRVDRGMPTWLDMIASDGEIDVTRVQALLFTVITLVALVITGTNDLANFSLPQTFLWLLGISQGVYVGGKLVTSEACRRLDTELKSLREAASAARDGDPVALRGFVQTREGALRTLREVYGSKLAETNFVALTPEEV